VTSNGKPGEHETFRIGSARTYKPIQSGYFYAYANDAWNFYENNRGGVTLAVSRLNAPQSRWAPGATCDEKSAIS
jgi:hypothetical protein